MRRLKLLAILACYALDGFAIADSDKFWRQWKTEWRREHRAWWGPGDVSGFHNAGRYTREQAIDICHRALGFIPEGVI